MSWLWLWRWPHFNRPILWCHAWHNKSEMARRALELCQCSEGQDRKLQEWFETWARGGLYYFHCCLVTCYDYKNKGVRGGGGDGAALFQVDGVIKNGSAWHPLTRGVSLHCSGEALVGIMILESMCWIRGTMGREGEKKWHISNVSELEERCIWLLISDNNRLPLRRKKKRNTGKAAPPILRRSGFPNHNQFTGVCQSPSGLTCVVHHFIPALLLPRAVPGVFSWLEVLVGWKRQTKVMARCIQRGKTHGKYEA